MTFLEAAVEVLRQAGRPLPVPEISALAIRHDLLTHVGRDPEGTMKARLEAELGRPPALARVTAIRPGVFTLTEAGAAVAPPRPPRAAAPSAPTAPTAPSAPPAASASTSRRRGRGTRQVAVVEAVRPEIPAIHEADDAKGVGEAKGTESAADGGDGQAASEAAPGEGAGSRSRRRRRRKGRRGKGGAQPTSAATASTASVSAPAPATDAAEVVVAPMVTPERLPTDGVHGSDTASAPLPLAREARRERAATPKVPPAASSTESRSLADVAYRILHEHADRRPIHYRQIADMALKRKLVPTDLSDPRRAMKVALLDDTRWRRDRGLRPRFHGEAGGLFSLASGRIDAGLVDREDRVGTAARELGETTRRVLLARLRALPLDAIEQLVRRALARRCAVEPKAVERHADHILLQAEGEFERLLVRLQVAPPERGPTRALGDRCRQQSLSGMMMSLADVPASVVAQGAALGVQMLGGAAVTSLLADCGVGIVRAALVVEYLDDELFEGLEP